MMEWVYHNGDVSLKRERAGILIMRAYMQHHHHHHHHHRQKHPFAKGKQRVEIFLILDRHIPSIRSQRPTIGR